MSPRSSPEDRTNTRERRKSSVRFFNQAITRSCPMDCYWIFMGWASGVCPNDEHWELNEQRVNNLEFGQIIRKYYSSKGRFWHGRTIINRLRWPFYDCEQSLFCSKTRREDREDTQVPAVFLDSSSFREKIEKNLWDQGIGYRECHPPAFFVLLVNWYDASFL